MASADSTEPVTGTVKSGDTIYYLVTLRNSGEDALPAKVVKDIPQNGITLTNCDTQNGTATLESDGTITWNAPGLASGEQAVMVVTATVNDDAKDNATNKATCERQTVVVTDPIPSPDPDPNPDPEDPSNPPANDDDPENPPVTEDNPKNPTGKLTTPNKGSYSPSGSMFDKTGNMLQGLGIALLILTGLGAGTYLYGRKKASQPDPMNEIDR